MNTTKISESDIAKLKIASLPSRPTAPAAFGGRGYTAKDMKAAFDKLPLFIIEKFNTLIDDILAEGENSITASIPSGVKAGHSLKNVLSDITDGGLSEYLTVSDMTLAEFAAWCKREISSIKAALFTESATAETITSESALSYN